MAGSLNKVTLIGNLGRDPDARTMSDGSTVVNLSLATSESWKDRHTGERKEKTEWHRVVIFNEGIAKVAQSYLQKGSTIYIEGALQTRKWTDQQGTEKYTTEIVLQKYRGELKMLGGRPDNQGGGAGGANQWQSGTYDQSFGGRQRTQDGARPNGPSGVDLDDEIPF